LYGNNFAKVYNTPQLTTVRGLGDWTAFVFIYYDKVGAILDATGTTPLQGERNVNNLSMSPSYAVVRSMKITATKIFNQKKILQKSL
tara:strand:- start:198 stop:458 length:261 start_codon:yes stop_codon:yes gene_type:complete